MFSLIITIISIALVAALALATIYYGGNAFNRGADSALASKLMTQAQQILAADRLYRADNPGEMPSSMEELVSKGYLKSIPVAQSSSGSFNAFANAGTTWSMISTTGGRAYAVTTSDLTESSCKEINKVSFGDSGILKNVISGFQTQCYGPAVNSLTVLAVVDPAALESNSLPNTPSIVVSSNASASDWLIGPSSGGQANGNDNTPVQESLITYNKIHISPDTGTGKFTVESSTGENIPNVTGISGSINSFSIVADSIDCSSGLPLCTITFHANITMGTIGYGDVGSISIYSSNMGNVSAQLIGKNPSKAGGED